MKFYYDDKKKVLVLKECTKLEYNQLTLWLEREIKGAKYKPAYKYGWKGTINYFNNNEVKFGLWRECLKAANIVGTNFEIINKTEFPYDRNLKTQPFIEFNDLFFKDHKAKTEDGEIVGFKPHDYQLDTAYKLLKHRYAIAEVATSGGKSLIASLIVFWLLKNRPNIKTLIIVPSITLVTQFTDEIIGFNNGLYGHNDNKLSVRIDEIMSDTPRKWSGQENSNISIGCYQSLANYPKEWFKQFDVVIIDEAHGCKAKVLNTVVDMCMHSEYRIGLSGTFPPDDSCEILTVQSVTGPKITEISAKQLIDRGAITPVTIKSIIMNYDDLDFDEKLKKIRKNPNNGTKAYNLEKQYIQNSEKRLLLVSKLLNKLDKNSLFLFNGIEFGNKVMEYLKERHPNVKFYYIDGKVSKKERERIKQEMSITNDGFVRVLMATYGTLAVGVSIKAIFNIVFLEGFKSEIRVIQSIGRGLRKHSAKKIATVYDLVDIFNYKKPTNALYRQYKERKILYDKHYYPYAEKTFNLS